MDDSESLDAGWEEPDHKPRTRAAAQAAPNAGAAKPEWLVNASGDAVVSMTQIEVLAALRSGRITAAALVWREGMVDWARADQVPSLKLALPKGAALTQARTLPRPTLRSGSSFRDALEQSKQQAAAQASRSARSAPAPSHASAPALEYQDEAAPQSEDFGEDSITLVMNDRGLRHLAALRAADPDLEQHATARAEAASTVSEESGALAVYERPVPTLAFSESALTQWNSGGSSGPARVTPVPAEPRALTSEPRLPAASYDPAPRSPQGGFALHGDAPHDSTRTASSPPASGPSVTPSSERPPSDSGLRKERKIEPHITIPLTPRAAPMTAAEPAPPQVWPSETPMWDETVPIPRSLAPTTASTKPTWGHGQNASWIPADLYEERRGGRRTLQIAVGASLASALLASLVTAAIVRAPSGSEAAVPPKTAVVAAPALVEPEPPVARPANDTAPAAGATEQVAGGAEPAPAAAAIASVPAPSTPKVESTRVATKPKAAARVRRRAAASPTSSDTSAAPDPATPAEQAATDSAPRDSDTAPPAAVETTASPSAPAGDSASSATSADLVNNPGF